MKRSGKEYRKIEAEVMESLGLKPTINSGSGWLEKEDGQNDKVIAQLKSTDANSIKISKLDLDKLEYNAMVAHKIPVFVIQFLRSNEVYLVMKPTRLTDLDKYLETGVYEVTDFFDEQKDISKEEQKGNRKNQKNISKRIIKSSSKEREDFRKEMEDRYNKKGKSAL